MFSHFWPYLAIFDSLYNSSIQYVGYLVRYDHKMLMILAQFLTSSKMFKNIFLWLISFFIVFMFFCFFHFSIERSSHSSNSLGVVRICFFAINDKLSWQSLVKGFSSKLRFSKDSQVLISSTSTSEMITKIELDWLIIEKVKLKKDV